MKDSVSHEQTTIANADLWSHYFAREWRRWLDPLGLSTPARRQLAQGTGARIAGLLSLTATGPLAWLYGGNYEPVAQIVGNESHAEVLPLHAGDDEVSEDPAA